MSKKTKATPAPVWVGKRPLGPAPDAVKEKKGMVSLRAAQRVQDLRRANGHSQQTLAQRAGIGLDTLRRFESAQGQIGVDNLERIAKALGVSISELVQ